MKKLIKNMRDCVKKYFEKGSDRGYEFKKMRHAIIIELKRLGFASSEIKDELLEWNQRCEMVLSLAERKRQLLDYVDWIDKKQDCWIGCKALEDFCIGKEQCFFYKRKTYINKEQVKDDPFDFDEARRFLEERYRADEYLMTRILNCLRRFQFEKATGETIFIGYRSISSLIREFYGYTIDPMTIFRRMQDLISEGMIEIVVKGKKGNFGQPANGYRFLKWKTPITQNMNNPY